MKRTAALAALLVCVQAHASDLYVYPRAGQSAEQQAKDAGYDVETSDHGIAGVGRAIIKGQTQGMVKIVSQVDGPVLGATVVVVDVVVAADHHARLAEHVLRALQSHSASDRPG